MLPGYSPAAVPTKGWATITALPPIAAGRPVAIQPWEGRQTAQVTRHRFRIGGAVRPV